MAGANAILLHKNISTLSSKDVRLKTSLTRVNSRSCSSSCCHCFSTTPETTKPYYRKIDRQMQEDYGHIMSVYKGTSKWKSKRLFQVRYIVCSTQPAGGTSKRSLTDSLIKWA